MAWPTEKPRRRALWRGAWKLSAASLVFGLAASCTTSDTPSDARRSNRTPGAGTASTTDTASRSVGFEADVAAITADAARLVEDGVVPGLVVLVRHDSDVRVLARGQADLSRATPMSPAHRFRIGSITKPMLAAVVLTLVQRRVLLLHDTVDRWLPGLVPHGDAITIEELLNHSSGIADYLALPRFSSAPEQRAPPPRRLVALGTSQPTLFRPGEDVHYSNTGYVLLGMIVERATHRSLADNLHDAVFAPVGMTTSSEGPPPRARATVARGYEAGKDVTGLDLGWAWAAGDVVSTVRDVSAFFDRLLSGRLLGPHMLRRMQRTGAPMPENGFTGGYGLGLAKVDTLCGSAWGHEGQLPGFSSAAWVDEKSDRQVVILANGTVDVTRLTFEGMIDTALCGSR